MLSLGVPRLGAAPARPAWPRRAAAGEDRVLQTLPTCVQLRQPNICHFRSPSRGHRQAVAESRGGVGAPLGATGRHPSQLGLPAPCSGVRRAGRRVAPPRARPPHPMCIDKESQLTLVRLVGGKGRGRGTRGMHKLRPTGVAYSFCGVRRPLRAGALPRPACAAGRKPMQWMACWPSRTARSRVVHGPRQAAIEEAVCGFVVTVSLPQLRPAAAPAGHAAGPGLVAQGV